MQDFFDIFDYFYRGGPLLLPIILVSVIMWVLILLQLQTVWAVNRSDIALDEALAAVRAQTLPAAFPEAPLARIVTRFIASMGRFRDDNVTLLNTLVERESSRLGCYINYIYALASIAPLLGLLGTVQGMIVTFDAIAVYGTGNPGALANGIAEALLTTQSGLFVSIPGLFMAAFLRRRVLRIGQRLNEFRAGVLKGLEN